MSDKEMNMAILNKLYEIAFAVWEKMAKVAFPNNSPDSSNTNCFAFLPTLASFSNTETK